ncbi:MAG: hypothetical protein FWG63_02380 [Defluviitaleaceae bacterium]|nr:hypothetical protein [Defluviitaleaceae bacterium]
MGYRICSLNVRRSIRGDEKDRMFYAFINKMIRYEGIDIFAFQEAKNINFIRNLKRNLQPGAWEGEAIYNNELAFIWNKYRVEECSRRKNPIALDEFKRYFNAGAEHMERPPVYGRFRPVDNQNIEFRFVNVHLYHGGDDSGQSIDRRKEECDIVNGKIYKTIDKPPQGKDGNFNTIFTMVMGDYNLDCITCNSIGLENVHTFQDENTTLRTPKPEYNNSELGYKNSYDHFSYDKDSSIPQKPSRIDAVNSVRYFEGDFQSYWDEVSDHVPVKIELLR